MTSRRFLIQAKFPTLNDLLREHGASPHAYAKTKKRFENRVASCARMHGMPAFRPGVNVTYLLLEKERRRDPSNVAAAAVKFVEDALVRMCVLPGDGWKSISAYNVEWAQEEFWGVCVTIEGEVCDEPRERIFKRKLQEERAKKLGKPQRLRAGAVGRQKRAPLARKAQPSG